jgi:parvulin-like peptidyl-prolyl isomerase
MIGFIILLTFLQLKTVDRIVGIVGNEAITESELNEYIALSGLPATKETEEEILNRIIASELLAKGAEKETLDVKEDELDNALDALIAEIKNRFPKEEDYENELSSLGLTESDLREKYRKETRKNLLARKLIQKKFGGPVSITDVEALHFYRTKKDFIPLVPARARFIGIFIPISLSESTYKKAEKRVEKIMQELKEGRSFSLLVKRYSDDEVTRERGGDLGMVRISDLQDEFRRVIQGLTVGDVKVLPVKDAIHILLYRERVGNRVGLSDIAIKVVPSKDDSIKAERIAGETRKIIENEGQIDTLKYRGVKVITNGEDFVPVSSPLDTIQIGKIATIRETDGISVIKILEREASRPPKFDEVKENIKLLIQSREMEQRTEKLLSQLKEKILVEKRL